MVFNKKKFLPNTIGNQSERLETQMKIDSAVWEQVKHTGRECSQVGSFLTVAHYSSKFIFPVCYRLESITPHVLGTTATLVALNRGIGYARKGKLACLKAQKTSQLHECMFCSNTIDDLCW